MRSDDDRLRYQITVITFKVALGLRIVQAFGLFFNAYAVRFDARIGDIVLAQVPSYQPVRAVKLGVGGTLRIGFARNVDVPHYKVARDLLFSHSRYLNFVFSLTEVSQAVPYLPATRYSRNAHNDDEYGSRDFFLIDFHIIY